MRKIVLIMASALLFAISSMGQTPLEQNGKLKLVGNQLSNECGSAIQLRGMSTHGPMWFENCTRNGAIQGLAENWGADIIRLAMYTEPNGNKNEGYLGNISKWDAWIDDMVTEAENNGMYIIIDWHILKDNDPHKYKTEAKTFFAKMSDKYKNKSHVLYEICNEPNGNVDWNRIKSYAEEVIPVIRANDPDGIIIVGTPEWSGKPWDVISNKLTGTNAHNVMYTFHFYSGSHYTQGQLRSAMQSIPIFATEWGTSDASGNGGYNAGNSNDWLNLLNGEGSNTQLVSWCNWSLSDKAETSAALTPGACDSRSWTNTSQSGTYVRNRMMTADNFPSCNSTTDSDGDGVKDIQDVCSDTPLGEAVNAEGCSDSDGDGVFNNNDLCPGTEANATVDIDGCKLNIGTTDFTAAIDSFNSVAPVAVGAGEYGVYWWVGEGGETTYDLDRTTDGMVLGLSGASPTYQVFGLSFGEEGSYINVKDFNNSDVNFNLTNNANEDIFLAIQLQDINGNKAEIFSEDPNGITWANQWEKIGITIPAGQTVDVTLALSADPSQLGGLQAGAYNCEAPTGTAVTCPATSYELDPTKIAQMIFIVNGGGVDGDADYPAVTGDLVFNHFSIGDVESPSSNIINASAIADADGDGVADEDDLCADTPAGTIVDEDGCALSTGSDADADGVDDAQDLCAATPSGATVNAQGCADSQLDSDSDGVSDDIDECSGTPIGATIDIKGCVVVTTNSLFHAAIDEFNTVEDVTVGADGEYGIYWWAGDAGTPYEVTRSTNGMTVSMTNASPTYQPFGVSFSGEDLGNYIDLEEFTNANIQMNITNNTNTAVTLTVQLQDVNGNIAEIVIENESLITWDNQWEKIGVVLPQGSTGNYTINLNGDINQLGGYEATDWNCGPPTGSAVTCPVVDYTFNASKLAQITFTVNGGAGVDNQLVAATGDLVFNYFAIGEIQDADAGVIKAGVVLDADLDGVADEDDLCPGTLVGSSVDTDGCAANQVDTDADGVVDTDDLCAGTPTGETANNNGCSLSQIDTDNDGVNDDKDICAGTVAGATVNADGCSSAQTDADGDGVYDGDDLCANTPLGSPVDADGCVIDVDYTEITSTLTDATGFDFANTDYAYDDFNSTDEKFADGPGIFWWDSENDPKPSFSALKDRRACDETTNTPAGVAYTITQDATSYEPFGVGFGENETNSTAYTIDLSSNSTLVTTIKNESNRELTIRTAIQDVEENILDFDVNEDQVQITLAAGATGTLTADYTNGYWYDYNSVGCNPCINEAADFFDYEHVKGVNYTVISGADHWKDDVANNIVDAVVVISSFELGNTAGVVTNGCGVVGLSKDFSTNVRVYPIPTTNAVTISQSKFEFTQATILNITGNVVQEVKLTNATQELSVDGLAKGTYLIQLKGAENAGQVRLVIQ